MTGLQKKNLNSVDLNLFKILNAMIEKRNVTLAAQSLGMSQPAVSHALNRLRSLFNDDLFVRTPQGMQPTERCLAVSEKVSVAVAELVNIIQPDEDFDPSEAHAIVRIAMSDLLTGLLPGMLVPKMSNIAPNIEFRFLPALGLAKEVVEQSLHSDLDAGRIDLAFFWDYDVPSRYSWHKLGEVDYVCVGSNGNKHFEHDLEIAYYEEAPHVSTTTIDANRTRLDQQLAEIGHTRNVKLRVPHFAAAMSVVSASDMITSIPRVIAPIARERYGLVVRELPFPSPVRHLNLVWHKTRDGAPQHISLRQTVSDSYRESNDAS